MYDFRNGAIAREQSTHLLNAILNGEKDVADRILSEWAEKKGYQSSIREILEPTLEIIGNRWDKEQISLAAGYLAGKVAEELLNKAAKNQEQVLDYQGTAVIGNIEDDYHSLGRRLIAIFLTAAGWKVIDLGNDITPKEFVDAALANSAEIIGVSAMMHTTALNIRGVREEMDVRNVSHKIKLAVGGAIFKVRPDLVKEVGGDGTASNAVDAPALFNTLKREIV